MSYEVSPGAYWSELDLSIRVQNISSSIGGIVVESDWGELNKRIPVSSVDDLDAVFGKPRPSQKALHSARRYASISDNLEVVRVARNARYGGVTFAKVRNDPNDVPRSLLAGWVTGENDPDKSLIFSDDMVFAIYDLSAGNHDLKVALDPISTGDGGFRVLLYQGVESQPHETYQVSLEERTNGNGDQLFIEQVINTRSNRYRAIVNRNYNGILSDDLVDQSIAKVRMQGGYNGDPVQSADVMAGYDLFKNPELTDASILIGGGWSRPEVQLKMDSIASSRRDQICVLDMPTEHQELSKAVAYRRDIGQTEGLGLDSSFSAIYTPDVLVYDEATATDLYLPPSGFVAAQYAYSDKVSFVWRSPAGMERGYMRGVKALREVYDQGDRNSLFEVQINALRVIPKKGFYIWGDTTLQTRPSALQFVPVRRTLSTICKNISATLLYFVFEPNDPILRTQIKSVCENYLDSVRVERGIKDYLVVCDNSNNPTYDTDAGKLNVHVFIKPVLSARIIKLTGVVTSQGAVFSEAVQQVLAAA